MEIITYHQEYDVETSLENFLELLFIRQMKYFASDLLKEGLSPQDIQDAMKRAMTVGKTSGIEIRQHFAPMYSQLDGQLVNDCQLSALGYGMVLLNARPEIPFVSVWQMKVLEKFFE